MKNLLLLGSRVFIATSLFLISAVAGAATEREFKGLKGLAEFSDIAIIQRKYLPKTDRFEFFGSLTTVMNDAFFLNTGLQGRFNYSWREQHAIEFTAMDVFSSPRQVTTDLQDERDVRTESIITPEAFFGLSYRWSPIYGKMSLTNKSIVPFDMYFSGGGGMTHTSLDDFEPTLHLGAGQIFAISKSVAFRWDFSYFYYQATAPQFNTAGDQTGESRGSFSNLYLTVGVSFFFPEAKYR